MAKRPFRNRVQSGHVENRVIHAGRFEDRAAHENGSRSLLKLSAEKDRVLAESLVHEIVPEATRYQINPAIYHDARRRILSALDQ